MKAFDLPATIAVQVQRLANGEGLELPGYQSSGAAGADVRAAESVTIGSGERAAVATGLAMAIPHGWEIQVRPRSGLAWKQGLTVVNAPGTIDADFRGELKILLVNVGAEPVAIKRGDRVAQLVLSPVHRAEFTETNELPPSDRGAGGFGSTGRR